jgi:hypothetical protein
MWIARAGMFALALLAEQATHHRRPPASVPAIK